ncbi:serine/threonine-protein kinase [Candidatus Uabimicrobium amorphum]|uniref:Protein kinase n=1 Tax=Uabimicrobium amorphum TaxID=2596890 RepID=A0A5S9F5C1_UABAM|nr:serine/threonine-protein kinase [Candidatus Uabimicrobium amorphum]BBM85509.1 protein kinase [Candidatus Uabimicrobium amorphum]
MSTENEQSCQCKDNISYIIDEDTAFAKINCRVCGRLIFMKIGPYTVKEVLGEGCTGYVYLAQTKEKKEVAIKVLEKPLQIDLDFFLRECVIQRTLQHPNIVGLLDQGHWKNFYYLVMEYFPGKTLDKIIEKKGYLPPRETIKIIFSVLNGLNYAAQNNVIHRDIKPENIYITKNKQIKILDFGLAKIKDDCDLSQTGSGKGSPCYMAPEQFQSAKYVDTRADIYSVGATMYHCLSGKAPFEEKSDILQIAAAKMTNSYQSLTSINMEIPKALENIVQKAMAYPIKRRYQTLDEFIEELYDYYQDFSAESER